MNDDGQDTDPTPAERRLNEHLELLRPSEPEAPGRALVRATVRRARLQHALRAPLRIAGLIAASVLDGLASLLGDHRRRG